MRMRQLLKKKQEALADYFDFKIYVAFVFKDPKKGSALFEASDVVPIMANNYENKIMKGVDRNIYSLESSQEMIGKDVVQLYIPRYVSMRQDMLGSAQDVDFFLWPRGDLLCIRCFVFSRWKAEGKKSNDEPYRVVQADFMFFSSEYELQLRQLLPTMETKDSEVEEEGKMKDEKTSADTSEDSAKKAVVENANERTATKTPGSILRGGKDLILNNSEQSMFLFINRYTQPQNPSRPAIFKLNGICLYLPQDILMCWGLGSIDEILQPFM